MPESEPISLEMINRLMSFDMTSNQASLPLIEFVCEYLAGLGVEPHLTYDDTGGKANLFATIGPANRPDVILSGHTDVVPVASQKWTVEPHLLTRQGDRLYGRGTADMKAYIGVTLALATVFC